MFTGLSQKMRKMVSGRGAWPALVAATVILLILLFGTTGRADLSSASARRVSRIINDRMAKLESYMRRAVTESRGEWLELDGLDEDMVIYRYVDDSLQSWCNQFSLDNDDISKKLMVQRFVNLRYNIISPLASVDTSVSYINMGPKWYLAKAIDDGRGCRVIGGLEVRNTMDRRSVNGINPRFRIGDQYTLNPISATGGTSISVSGVPVLKMVRESAVADPLFPDTTLLWIVMVAFGSLALCLLHFNRKPRMMVGSMLALTVMMAVFYFIGLGMQGTSTMFSPNLYAGGTVLYSLGALLIINLWITLIVACFLVVRKEFEKEIIANDDRRKAVAIIVSVYASSVLLAAYAIYTFGSLMLNSNLTLELYKLSSITRYTAYVYASYLALMSLIPLLIQSARRVTFHFYGIRYDVFSRWGRCLYALFCSVLFLLHFSILGIRKEADRAEIWTSRLAMDRDLGLELRLREVENAIASDNVIAEVVRNSGDYKVVLNRIAESYLNRISKGYDVSVFLFKDNVSDPQILKYFNERFGDAVPIAPGSRFSYGRSSAGRPQYTGLFMYYFPDDGVYRLLVGLNSKADKEDRGYSFILDESSPGGIVIPVQYSYAKYIGGKLVSYKGDYAYPTVLGGKFKSAIANSSERAAYGNYVHFYEELSPEESIVISRPRIGVLRYVVAGCMIFLLAYFWISTFTLGRKRTSEFEKNYYKSRVNAVILLSMTMTLVTMSLIMVFFVYKRNDENVRKLMSSKITTIQSLVANRVRGFSSFTEMAGQDVSAILDEVARYTRTDISLYSPGGKVFNSTSPEIFERMIIGSRTNPEAYRNIMYNRKRFYIHRERVAGRSFYTMYAPLINDKGDILAILSAPYTDSGLSFKADAIFHSIFVITVFFILLILTRFFTTKVVDKMFGPLSVMGRKMLSARTGGLEYIIYDKEDEISGLVRAYNLMVHDLYESGKQVAQAERERAWSEMARQVAHEIKNPLTPMKLKIQGLIRMRQNNDPKWITRFDDAARVVLDSIDVLTDTANEFSTFAKLYSEEMVEIDLDALASDQISMFDNREDIIFEYYGLRGAKVMGPKPQLTRVFVNLLTNAVQALEARIQDGGDIEKEQFRGRVVLSLRNSSKDGFYDIVVEDNGPGIKDENRARLFTPNFTTKSSGTGLGLAICKNIIERCGGEIFYSRSFSLKGACFTVRYPKPPTSA